MNEREKLEFEHHKKLAEEQLNNMYYGAGKKSQNTGFKMPSFLSSPKEQNNKVPSTGNFLSDNPKNQVHKSESHKEVSTPKIPQKKNSIFDFFNFKGMKMDNDRLIIIAICLLLGSEDIDELLILALIYIML